MAFPQFNPLSFEQANPLLSGLLQGQKFGQSMLYFPGELENQRLSNILNQYKTQYEGERSKNYPALIAAELSKAQAEPQEIMAKTKLYGTEANRYSQLLPYEIQEKKAQSELHGAEAEKAKMIAGIMKNYGNYSSGTEAGIPSSQVTQQNIGSKNMGNYGIQIPRPSQEDIVNKIAFGIDSFGSRMQAAAELQKKAEEKSREKVIQSNKELEEAVKFDNYLSQYDYWMDEAYAKGPWAGHFPALGTASQAIDNLRNYMSLGGIEQVRSAMESARFAVADLNVALGLKPDRTWTKETREFYKNFTRSIKDRLSQRAQFYNIASALKMPNDYTDALWSSYQQQYPITNPSTGKIVKRKGDEWKQFLGEQPLNEIMTKGTYQPIKQSDITEKNIQDTMKSTGLSREEIINKLYDKGFNISNIKR